MDEINTQTTDRVKEMYNKVSYTAYNEDYFPVFKALGLSRQELEAEFKNKTALEVGCGGGQLSAFMASFFGHVTAVDISTKSLETATAECAKRGINNIEFKEANIFDQAFIEANKNKFDFILCYGVLHHTANPEQGFKNLTQLLKPGGKLLVGVYSRTQIWYRIKRQVVIWLAGDNAEKRARIANKLFFNSKANIVSLYDGYVHPQVSLHSIGEVYGWARKNNLNYIGSWPYFELPKYFSLSDSWHFLPAFWLTELVWILSGKSVMVSMAAIKK